MSRILVVDDEPRIRDVVSYALSREGFSVQTKESGDGIALLAQKGAFDLVILDVMMPGPDGLEVCRELRKHSTVPVLFLSAKGEEIDRVLGLELGGDDYLTKPFSPRELVARVKAILRRASTTSTPQPSQLLTHGSIEVDCLRHEVRAGKHEVELTATEFGVLSSILERPGVVLSRNQLMERAYAFDNHITERTIDTHVKRIRAKFKAVGEANPIRTVHGVGYKAGVES